MDITPACHLRWNVKHASLTHDTAVLTLSHVHAAQKVTTKGGELKAWCR